MVGTCEADRDRPGSSPWAGGRPSWLAGMLAATGRLLARPTIALVGLAVVVGAVAPWSEPEGRTGSEADATSPAASTITLRIPDGEAARSLIVVDESGRELAALTRWRDGTIGLSSRRDGGTGLWCGMKGSGEGFANLVGTDRKTSVVARPDGTARTVMSDLRDAGPPAPPVPARHASIPRGWR